jgi:coenzyme F420-reducing hydrogenase delta subunit
MCSGRVDLEFMLRAFSNGQDGVFIGGCRLGECNYITHGNYDALAKTFLCKKIMEHIGLNPERLRIQFMSGADGNLLAEATDEFSQHVKALGPLGSSEGLDADEVTLKLEAARKLVPYIRLVERERFRIPAKSEEAYNRFFSSDEFERMFQELILDKFEIGRIMSLVREKPLAADEIAKALELDPADVSRHIYSSARQGLIRFDGDQNLVAAA